VSWDRKWKNGPLFGGLNQRGARPSYMRVDSVDTAAGGFRVIARVAGQWAATPRILIGRSGLTILVLH